MKGKQRLQYMKDLDRHRVITAFSFNNSLFCHKYRGNCHGLSQHSKTFGIRDGLQEPFPQLVFGGVFRQQQCVKAGVRGGKPAKQNKTFTKKTQFC